MAQRENKPRGGAAAKNSGGGKARGGTLIGIVIGLVLGLLIAVGVAVFLNKGTKPFADKTGRERPPVVKGDGKSASNDPNAPLYGKDARVAEPKKDGKDDDRFSFYKILPGEEKGGADKGSDAKKDAPKDAKDAKGTDVAKADTTAPKDAASPTGKEQYFLQVGAFGSAGDADNQKAKLALMGFEARVEATEVEGKGTLHRVRIGPYARLDDINRVRSTLAQNGVDASLVKMKDAQK
jgi:cell division protein FtsN